jgi:hypothetical protein
MLWGRNSQCSHLIDVLLDAFSLTARVAEVVRLGHRDGGRGEGSVGALDLQMQLGSKRTLLCCQHVAAFLPKLLMSS